MERRNGRVRGVKYMTPTNTQRAVLLDLSHGDWDVLATYHDKSVIGRCNSLGLIRWNGIDGYCNHTRAFVITPDGLDALEADQ
jgi:hypothetical protein